MDRAPRFEVAVPHASAFPDGAAQLARAAAAVAAAVGLAVLVGWSIDSTPLKSVVHGLPAMRPWTATSVVLAALSLWLADSRSRAMQAVSAVPAAAVVAIAGTCLVEHVTRFDLGIDLLLFREKVLWTLQTPGNLYTAPGRITPITALGLVAVGSSLLIAPHATSRLARTAFSLLATAGLAIAAVGLLGYALGLEPLHAMLFGYIPAVNSSACIGLLALGTISLRPDVGWARSVAELGRTGWAAAALLGGAVLLFGYSAQVTVRAATRAQDATAAALRLETLLSTIKDAETGKRGFLLTGDDSYLAPYEAARGRLDDQLAALGAERTDLPPAALGRIRALVDAKMVELTEAVMLGRAGNTAAAVALVQTGRGKVLMDDIRTAADALVAAQTQAAAAARAEELRAAGFAAFGSIALVALAFWAVTATAHARREAAERAAAAAQALAAKEAEARENERRMRDVQTELEHANRVATMGQLTASIAHEVKQPIAATLTNAQAALRWLEVAELDEVRDALARIVGDADRAAAIIGRIRGLVEKAPGRRDVLDVNMAIRDVVALLRSELLKHDVAVVVRLADALPLVRGDRVQLQQVILNLMMNALEAMTTDRGGPRELVVSSGREPSGGVRIAVRDSGPGLSADDGSRVFDAFYTTKPDGLGMGLSICRSIVAAHGGRMSLRASEPRGAVFEFILPSDAS